MYNDIKTNIRTTHIAKFVKSFLKLLLERKKDGRTNINTPSIYIIGIILLIMIFY